MSEANLLKRIVKGLWWLLITILTLPIAWIVLFFARSFEWLGETFQSLFDWMCEQKHRVAPYPPPSPKKAAEIEAAADADL